MSDTDRVDSYIYHYLGMERDADQDSDNAFTRYHLACEAYRAGTLPIPDDWETPPDWNGPKPDAATLTPTTPPTPPTPTSRSGVPVGPDRIHTLIGMLESGMWQNELVQSLLDTLEHKPQCLLPDSIGLVSYAAFLMTKVDRHAFGRRMMFACLAWCIENGLEELHGADLIGNIAEILRQEGHELDAEEIRRRAIEGDHGAADSSVIRWDASHRDQDPDRAALSIGIDRGVSAGLPLSVFTGWIKQHDPTLLNVNGQALMSEVFSRFGGEFVPPEEYLRQAERLLRLGVQLPSEATAEIVGLRRALEEGVRVEIRQHRRYAGGDGRLPRGCYSTVCSNEAGDDAGTVSREALAYVHPAVPGIVFAADSSNDQANSRLGVGIGVRPGSCAQFVLLIAPEDTEQRQVFRSVYAKTLEHTQDDNSPLSLSALEMRVERVRIERVIDLRRPETQTWFFEKFALGDGMHFSKPNGGNASSFLDMLPTLMHPELGGCATTHGIGSWMRTNSVSALIYPSARSDIRVDVRDGQVVDSRGWILVDYRDAEGTASSEVVRDEAPWLGVDEFWSGVAVSHAEPGSPEAGSWAVTGVQARYDNLFHLILDRGPGGAEDTPRPGPPPVPSTSSDRGSVRVSDGGDSMIRFVATDARGEFAHVDTASIDSFYTMRDDIHDHLETGEFGSRFPRFMLAFEPTEWPVEQVPELQQELEIIVAMFKQLPPEPVRASNKTWDEIEAGGMKSLYDVYRDAAGDPLLGRLIDLCKWAQRQDMWIKMI